MTMTVAMTVYACDVCSAVPDVSELTLPLSPEPSVIRDALGVPFAVSFQHTTLHNAMTNPPQLLAAKSSIIHTLNVQKLRSISLQKLPKNMDESAECEIDSSGRKTAHFKSWE